MFWLHSETIVDRHAAREVANAACINQIRIVRLGETGLNRLTSPLDELVTLSTAGYCAARFFRMQALLFLVVDMLLPYLQIIPMPIPPAKRRHISPTLPRWRQFVAIRPEIREIQAAMRANIAQPWSLTMLREIVHLSGLQTSRVFVRTYGKTPLAYQTMLRVEEMTCLLCETDLTTETISRQVGWACREHVAEMFRRYVGVTPTEYRRNGPPTTRRD